MAKKTLDFFDGRTAVFIDAANLERSLADLGTEAPHIKKIPKGFKWKAFPKGYWKLDYKRLCKYFKHQSNLVSISFYSARFDTESHNKFLAFLKFSGYRLITKQIKKITTRMGDHPKKS